MILELAEIASLLQIEGSFSGKAIGFQQDSRLVKKGDLFFALSGNKVDGHLFLEEIAKKGAIGAIVDKGYRGPDFGLTLFRVEDVKKALHDLARLVHQKQASFVVGVTGSVGKTTTKEFIAQLLSVKYQIGKTPGNANSQVGMPLALLNAAGTDTRLVLEMGMSAPEQIKALVSIAPPDIAVITQIALAHAEFFPDGLEGIAKAKGEILLHPKTKLAFIHIQAFAFGGCHQGACRKITYGPFGSGAQVMWKRQGQEIQIYGKEEISPPFAFPFDPPHLIDNGIGAILCARACGLSFDEIISALPNLVLPDGRFQIVKKEGAIFINDAYNANPTSMKAAIAALPFPSSQGKRYGVLGAMKELGEHTQSSHEEIGKFAAQHLDYILCFGQESKFILDAFCKEGKKGELFSDLSTLQERVFSLAKEGDVFLVKGSNSNRLASILEESDIKT